jgi:hypothetical protein
VVLKPRFRLAPHMHHIADFGAWRQDELLCHRRDNAPCRSPTSCETESAGS